MNEAGADHIRADSGSALHRQNVCATEYRGYISRRFSDGGPLVHDADSAVETTRIIWHHTYEVFECVKCHSIMHYNFGFERCPYCFRRVESIGRRGMTINPVKTIIHGKG